MDKQRETTHHICVDIKQVEHITWWVTLFTPAHKHTFDSQLQYL